MKKTTIILFVAFGIAKAQVKVNTAGNVGIGTTSPSVWFNPDRFLHLNGNRPTLSLTPNINNGYGTIQFKGNSTNSEFHLNFIDGSPSKLQFYSYQNPSTTNMVITGDGNIGISTLNPNYKLSFGSSNINYKTIALYEAGSEFYGLGISPSSFDFWIGNTGAQYRFRAPNGSVGAAITSIGDVWQNNSYARNYWTNSDKRLKENIITCTNALDKVLSLRGVYYDMKDSVDTDLLDNETKAFSDTSKNLKKGIKKLKKAYGAASPSKKQYGLIAQEVETILPELVSTSTTSAKSVNYTAIIPLLIEAIRDLNSKNETLEAKIKKLEKGKSAARTESTTNSIESISGTYLFQNTPNPFSQETQIRYSIPETTGNAFITITDLAGKQIKTLPIVTKGESFVSLKANELYAGLFAYTLVVDGNIIDTKRMVIVE